MQTAHQKAWEEITRKLASRAGRMETSIYKDFKQIKRNTPKRKIVTIPATKQARTHAIKGKETS